MVLNLLKGFVPETYSESRDYRVFLKLLGIVATEIKNDISKISSVFDPDECPQEVLYLLADLIGYEYDTSFTEEENRRIIKYFPYIYRNKGDKLSMKMILTLFEPNNLDTDDIFISSDYDKGVIELLYPDYPGELQNRDKLLKLLNYVRPLGMTLKLRPLVNVPPEDIVSDASLEAYSEVKVDEASDLVDTIPTDDDSVGEVGYRLIPDEVEEET